MNCRKITFFEAIFSHSHKIFVLILVNIVLCSTKYAPTIWREQQNTHKKYVQDMTKILQCAMYPGRAHGLNGDKKCRT